MMVDTTLGLPQSLWPLRSPKWLSGPVSFPLKRLARALPILCGSCEMVARGQVYYHLYHYCYFLFFQQVLGSRWLMVDTKQVYYGMPHRMVT